MEGPFQCLCGRHSSSSSLAKDLPQYLTPTEHCEEVSEEQSGKVGVAERRERGCGQERKVCCGRACS